MKELQDPEEIAEFLDFFTNLLELQVEGELDIHYVDESGFNLRPKLGSGWQKKGETLNFTPKSSPRINVFGLLKSDGKFESYYSKSSLNSELICAFLDDFVSKLQTKKTTVLIMDNATIHHSNLFKEKAMDWADKDVLVFYLPKYSPHLNPIEMLWKKIKYLWLSPKDYLDFETLETRLAETLADIGKSLFINLKQKMSIISG